MPELFVELFSEEIPARMQARAAEDLSRLAAEALAPLRPARPRTWHGPRRIALALEVAAQVAASASSERGPRLSAPEQALAGFLRKHGAGRDSLRQEGDYWVLERRTEPVAAAALIGREFPALLRRFPWPKSMRWGRSGFTWVRPLRRIVCLLDGAVVPFSLQDGADAAHGLAADRLTEGHRFLAPGAVAVEGAQDWADKLRDRRVLVDAGERRDRIAAGLAALAAARGLTVAQDEALLTEVSGLVEWPVPFLGRIDDAYMDLPPEVLQVSMRVNQRTFSTRAADGTAAPWFGFVANIEPADSGAATIAGNERVLRARFADARHFWDIDRRTPLADRVAALDGVTFHARIGTQGERARRIAALAAVIAPLLGAGPAAAERAGLLAKADLTTGMVGEFPELQGVMGGYYARADEGDAVADAIRDHYAPKGPAEPVPTAPVSVAVALADKLDQIVQFFAIGEKPTGSGDPYGLRRAALGVLRIILAPPGRPIALQSLLADAGADGSLNAEVFAFFMDRLRVMLRQDGKRHDIVSAVFAIEASDNIVSVVQRAEAIGRLLATADGESLMVAYRRAANILRIETQKDGPFDPAADRTLFTQREEQDVADAIDAAAGPINEALLRADYDRAMAAMALLRRPLDAFFERVTVNAAEARIRRNRLALLSEILSVMHQVADFSKIEG
jgi:glycyl-tRNA synthetase beta chain